MAKVAQTRFEFIGDGATVQFGFTFPYFDSSDITVLVDGAVPSFTVSGQHVVITPAPAVGAEVLVQRDTDAVTLKHQFSHGSPLTAQTLDTDFTQVFYVVQEAYEIAVDARDTADESILTANQALANSNYAIGVAEEARDTAEQAFNAVFGYSDVITIAGNTTLIANFGGKWIRCPSNGATVTQLTVVDHVLNAGFMATEMIIENTGAGYIQFVAAPGVTLQHKTGTAPLLLGQGTIAALKQVALGQWVLYGALEDL